jgi:hypothetical protein
MVVDNVYKFSVCVCVCVCVCVNSMNVLWEGGTVLYYFVVNGTKRNED